jgi:hypothetical protein
MLKKSTIKLAGSVLGGSLIAVILSLLIVMMLGGIGAKSNTSSSSTLSGTSSAASSSASTSAASSSAVSGQDGASSLSSETSQPVYSEGGLISHTAGRLFLGIISILIYIAIVYNTAWQEGNKDPNRIKYGHMDKFMAKGLVAGLLASIPYAVLTTVFIVSQAISQNGTAGIVINTLYRFLNIQYIVFGDGYLNYPFLCFLLLLVLPAISMAGYIAGYHRIVFISKIIYKNQKKKDGTYRKNISVLKK